MLIPILAGAVSLIAQNLSAQDRKDPKPLRIVMEESLEKQRESVRKQMRTVQEADPGWFTVPWTRDKEDQFIRTPKVVPTATPTAAASPAPCSPILPVSFDSRIGEVARSEKLPESILRSVIRKESAFNPCAVSSKGAMGLMQLIPSTAAALGVKDPFDPAQNLAGGARYLGQMLEKYGDWKLALAAYNAGPNTVDKYGGVPPFGETLDYVSKVLKIE